MRELWHDMLFISTAIQEFSFRFAGDDVRLAEMLVKYTFV